MPLHFVQIFHSAGTSRLALSTPKPSLEVAPTTLATLLADQKIKQLLILIYSFEFGSAFIYYLFTVLATLRSAILAVQLLRSCFIP